MHYFISQVPNKKGQYEIHIKQCFKHDMLSNRLYLGEFTHCEEALQKAKKHFKHVVFCPHCLPHCIKKEPTPNQPNKELFEDIFITKK
jgi:hypothetical protein